MIELKLSLNELKRAIMIGKLIGQGFYSCVFTYNDKLIKLDKYLYYLLKDNNIKYSIQATIEYYQKELKDFNSREQLEELIRRQAFIRPKVPEGIVSLKGITPQIDGISPGIIIPPFRGYTDLDKIDKSDYKRLLMIFRRILDDIKNLADYEISQDDLIHLEEKKHIMVNSYNIIQNEFDAQIIDMSGPNVHVGKEFDGPTEMYIGFLEIINDFLVANGLKPIYKNVMDLKEDDLENMLKEFDKGMRCKR